MRGAAALTYLSLQHVNLMFDWIKEQNRNSPKVNLLLTRRTSVLDQPKISCAFNGLRFVVHVKARSRLGDRSCSVRLWLGFYAVNRLTLRVRCQPTCDSKFATITVATDFIDCLNGHRMALDNASEFEGILILLIRLH